MQLAPPAPVAAPVASLAATRQAALTTLVDAIGKLSTFDWSETAMDALRGQVNGVQLQLGTLKPSASGVTDAIDSVYLAAGVLRGQPNSSGEIQIALADALRATALIDA